RPDRRRAADRRGEAARTTRPGRGREARCWRRAAWARFYTGGAGRPRASVGGTLAPPPQEDQHRDPDPEADPGEERRQRVTVPEDEALLAHLPERVGKDDGVDGDGRDGYGGAGPEPWRRMQAAAAQRCDPTQGRTQAHRRRNHEQGNKQKKRRTEERRVGKERRSCKRQGHRKHN